MANKKGNRANVMNRWYGRDKDGYRHQKQRVPFKGVPQYSFDDLYITPFTHDFTADDMGRTGYTPIERNLKPTGIHVFDACLQDLHRGHSYIADFCDRYNARTSDLDGLIFLLTGMANQDFRNRWILIYERDLNTSPTTRRNALRKPGECGRYKIVENNK